MTHQKPPSVEIKKTTLEFDLKPKLSMDFGDLINGNVKINGAVVKISKSKNFLMDFDKAYKPEHSFLELLLPKANAGTFEEDYGKSQVFMNIVKGNREIQAERAAMHSGTWSEFFQVRKDYVVTQARIAGFTTQRVFNGCWHSNDDETCGYMDLEKAMVKKLYHGYYQGLNKFNCTKKRLIEFQALRSATSETLPLYKFNYDNPKNIKITVKNYRSPMGLTLDCDFEFNRKTIKVAEGQNDECQPDYSHQGLSAIGVHTPVQNAFDCCAMGDTCARKFENDMICYSGHCGFTPKFPASRVP